MEDNAEKIKIVVKKPKVMKLIGAPLLVFFGYFALQSFRGRLGNPFD